MIEFYDHFTKDFTRSNASDLQEIINYSTLTIQIAGCYLGESADGLCHIFATEVDPPNDVEITEGEGPQFDCFFVLKGTIFKKGKVTW